MFLPNRNDQLALSDHDRKLLAILDDYDIDWSPMACEFSRQQGNGVGRFKGAMRGYGDGTYNVEYDLMLCTYCGNLLPQKPCCPAKFARFKELLTQQYLQVQSERAVLLLPAWKEPRLLPQFAGH